LRFAAASAAANIASAMPPVPVLQPPSLLLELLGFPRFVSSSTLN
jgi:hypothetical protein